MMRLPELKSKLITALALLSMGLAVYFITNSKESTIHLNYTIKAFNVEK